MEINASSAAAWTEAVALFKTKLAPEQKATLAPVELERGALRWPLRVRGY